MLAQRIEACCTDLADPRQATRAITDIALDRGFTSLAHFSRVFRAATGCTPSDYRRRAGA